MSRQKKEISYDSRDYDFKEIETDERFRQTAKEFWVTLLTFGIFIIFLTGNLYLNGRSDVAHYKYVFGFPLWIFLEIVILVGMVVAVELVVTFVYRDMDVTPTGKLKPRHRKQDVTTTEGQEKAAPESEDQ